MGIAGPWSTGPFAGKCDATTDNKPRGGHARLVRVARTNRPRRLIFKSLRRKNHDRCAKRAPSSRWLVAAFKEALARLHRAGTVFASGLCEKTDGVANRGS